MGLCGSRGDRTVGDGQTEEQRARDKQVEQTLNKERKVFSSTKRLLLLGAGDTGKSTFLRQLNVLYPPATGSGASSSSSSSVGSSSGTMTTEQSKEPGTGERLLPIAESRELIGRNLIQSIQGLLVGCESLGVPLQRIENREIGIRVLSWRALQDASSITPSMVTDIESLWADEGIHAVAERSRLLSHLPTNYEYFLDNAKRLAASDYRPSIYDLLLCRNKTTGVLEYTFFSGKHRFSVIDVGGQRAERRKWIHQFEAVDCLLFFVSLAEYDQTLEEDPRVCRISESLRLFQEIVNSRWFESTTVILFLNKDDLFRQKIEYSDLRIAFPEYTGGLKYQPALEFITQKFLSLNRSTSKSREVFVHVTCATDTSAMNLVFNAISQSLLKEAMVVAGIE